MRTLDLGGTWLLASRPAAGAAVPCPIPGTAAAALVRAGAAPDPRASGADLSAFRATWSLSRSFSADAALLRESRVALEIPFLPAGASVSLNGRVAIPASPAAGPRRADVRRLLGRGANEIAAVFPPERPAPPDPAAAPSAPPRVPAAGLPRGAVLRAWSGARIADIGFGQRHDAPGPATLLAGGWIETDGPAPAGLSLSLRLLDPDGAPAAEADATFPAGGAGSFHAALRVPKPRLWWPAGLGPQPLYAVEAVLRDARGGVLDAATARVGLRTLAPVPRAGGSAALACNGRPFFLRGAVWRCPNPVAPPVSRGDFEPLLASAADGRFNALRLAPDEPPPPDAFWELCDELGLVVLGAAPAAEAALAAAEAAAGAPVSAAPPFLRHPCVPDVLLGVPDEDSGLAIVRTPVSLPSPEALAAELPLAERNPTGPALERRTALRGGPAALVASLAAEWPLPARAEDWAWLSQLAAARAMRRRVAAARTAPGATGFLWDPFASAWAAADAASIDRDGRWKALQYEAARVFAPEALFAPAPDADPREPARYVNATPLRRRGTLAWRLTTMDGTTLAQGSRALSVPAFSHAELPLPDPAPYFARWDAGSLALWLSVLDGEGFVVSRDHRLYAPPRRLRLQDPGLAVDVAAPQTVDGEQVWRVTVSVSAPAFGIFLDLPGRPALFGDGYFALEPDETLDVEVTPLSPMRETAFRRALRVRSLWDLAFG